MIPLALGKLIFFFFSSNSFFSTSWTLVIVSTIETISPFFAVIGHFDVPGLFDFFLPFF